MKTRFDPEEIVKLHGRGDMTLRSAVREAMKMAPVSSYPELITIFREGQPSILTISDVEELARLPEYKA